MGIVLPVVPVSVDQEDSRHVGHQSAFFLSEEADLRPVSNASFLAMNQTETFPLGVSVIAPSRL